MGNSTPTVASTWTTMLLIPILFIIGLASKSIGGAVREDEDMLSKSGTNCDCKAGIINNAEFENRIINGVETPPNKYPWLVGLVLENENSTSECGGSLLSSRTVLTAAHCPNTGWVVTGQHVKSIISGNERWYKVKSKTNHPLYNNRTVAYDLAIITLEQDVEFNQYARPVCLPTDCTQEYANDQVWVAGWGVESWSYTTPANQSNVLRRPS